MNKYIYQINKHEKDGREQIEEIEQVRKTNCLRRNSNIRKYKERKANQLMNKQEKQKKTKTTENIYIYIYIYTKTKLKQNG